jgi:hypothetical protein
MGRAAARDQMKDSIVKGQAVHVGKAKARISDRLLRLEPSGLCHHFRRQVNSDDRFDVRRKRKGRMPGAGCNI